MAKYTIELRKVCNIYTREVVENWFKDYDINDYLRPEETQILNKNNMWSKEKLAKKIVDHYYMREIGFETPALFKHYAKVTMNEIMEEKLPLLYSRSIEYDPLINVDFTETFTRTIDSEGTTNSNDTSESRSDSTSSNLGINNNTPQQRITKQNLDSGIYASNTNQNDATTAIEDSTTTSSNSSNDSSMEEHYSRTQRGNAGVSATAQKMVEQYRDNIRAIDKEIIEELNILFMGLY